MNGLSARLGVACLLIVSLGCSEPSGPSQGSLRITVNGLPSGTSAQINVTGPGGFSQIVTGTQTLTQLAPGTYALSAASVNAGSSEYSPSPASQTVSVYRTDIPATASVLYSTATGNLTVSISGLGTSSPAAVTVTGPDGFTREVPRTETFTGLAPGSYTVLARDTTAAGGTTHTPDPASQTVLVQAQQTASAAVTYNPPPYDGTVNLRIAGMYLTQSAQNYSGNVPLVRNRPGYLRVFVVGNRVNTATPFVEVRFYNGLVLQSTATIPAPGLSVPTSVDESSLSYSWNVPVSASLIQPNLMIHAEVDPGHLVDEDSELDNTYPATGPLAMNVLTVPTLPLTFVPILQRGIPIQRRHRGNVTELNKAQFMETTQKMHPLEAYDAEIHADYTTITLDTLQDDNGNNAWGAILGEIDALRLAESSTRYYYGIAKVSYNSGVAGVAYVSTPQIGALAGLGWDYLPSGSIVVAHELGHNWARNHAPCGGALGVDQLYPHPDGSTGGYGLDVATQTLQPPTRTDVMGYCDDKWISEYTYTGVMNYLRSPSPPYSGVVTHEPQPSLLVWGHVRDGEMVLEPAFEVMARPSLPSRPGPYSLEGRGEDGGRVFSLSFAPLEIADGRGSRQNFAFTVPLQAGQAKRLSELRLAGPGRPVVLRRATAAGPAPAAGALNVRRVAGNRVALKWNVATHPMVMVRDAATGEVLSFARGGDVEFATLKSQVDLTLSDGVRSSVRRVRVGR